MPWRAGALPDIQGWGRIAVPRHQETLFMGHGLSFFGLPLEDGGSRLACRDRSQPGAPPAAGSQDGRSGIMTSAPGQRGVPSRGSGEAGGGRLAALAASAGAARASTPKGEKGRRDEGDFVSLGILGLPAVSHKHLEGALSPLLASSGQSSSSVSAGARSGRCGGVPGPSLHIRPLKAALRGQGGLFLSQGNPHAICDQPEP